MEMAEKNEINADTSDGSEESWILLDEIDEAIKEEKISNFPKEYQCESVDSTETLNELNADEVGNEAIKTNSMAEDIVNDTSNVQGYQPNDEDDYTGTFFRISGNDKALVYDESCDGFTTDGSISILGDREIQPDRFRSDDLYIHTTSPQPMQMWMRCTPIDMAINAKRPLELRQRNQVVEVCKSSSSSENFRNFLDLINREIFLLVLTASFLGIISILYAQLVKMEGLLRNVEYEKHQIEFNLEQCYNRYDIQMNNSFGFITERNNDDKEMPAVHDALSNEDTELIIQPTKVSDGEYMKRITKNEQQVDQNQIVWTDAEEYDDDYASEIFRHSECNDKYSEFARQNKEYCRKLKNIGREKPKVETPEIIYSTYYSYKAIDDKECNPNKIDFNLGIQHARKVFRDSNCDDEGTMRYLQKAYDYFQKKTKANHSNSHKERKNTEKMNVKLDKSEKYEKSVIKIEKNDKISSKEYFDHNDKKDRRDKKQQKMSDKENIRKNDRKDLKKYHHDKDQNKRNKNERKHDLGQNHDDH